ncbi:hypothetical protein SMD20_47920 [Nonomuraea sp. LP-02]|uniref:hypothetical protein n=1 Tax=Nonomuraea sp. LP-02 TaxID=3097960 RepID=UPI002E2F9B5E|nr:hypothetical protein [Nonomuraea sp. LP-02]MED7932018.1 hypothetical protein [Nonomuraea sp. LP-02]
MADIARVSLAQGNEHRSAAPTMSDLWNIHGMFHQHVDRHPEETPLKVHLLQLFNQQLEGQADGYQAQARSAAILLDASTDKPLKVIGKPGWEQDLFGCSLVQYVAAARLIRACALSSAGRVNPEVLNGPEAGELLEHIDQATFDAILARHFVTDTASFKEAERPWRQKATADLRRYTYNPLRESPLINGYGPGYLCPSPHLVWSKSTPLGLYFTGRKHYGDMSFAGDMGHLFEAYIGRHLRLLPMPRYTPRSFTGKAASSSRASTGSWSPPTCCFWSRSRRPCRPRPSGSAISKQLRPHGTSSSLPPTRSTPWRVTCVTGTTLTRTSSPQGGRSSGW